MRLRIVVEDDARIEQIPGIKKLLDLAHQVGCLAAPFLLDKGRHIASRSVLCLQRAIVLVDHQVAHLVHEARIAFNFNRVIEVLREYKVQVALQRVAKNDAFGVAMFGQQRLQVQRRRCQRGYGEGHVFNDDGGSRAAHCTYRREGALAHLPVHVAGGGIGGETGRAYRRYSFYSIKCSIDEDLKRIGRLRPHFDEQRRRVRPQGAHRGRHARLVFHRPHGRPVQQFDRRHGLALEAHHRLTGQFNRREKYQRAGLVRIFDHRVVGDARNKAQRAFRANHQMGQDVDRVLVVDQRIEAVARGVLDPVFLPYARGQCRVGAGLCPQSLQRTQQRGVALLESRYAERVFGVEHRPVGQHHAQGLQRVVAVLLGAAAHARGIVGGYTAYLAGVDRRGIRPYLFAKRRQSVVDFAAYDARAQAHCGSLRPYFAGCKAFTDQHQDAVGDGLSRKAGSCRAKGQVLPLAGRNLEHGLHFFFVLHHGDHLRCQPVKARIGPVGQTPETVGDELLRGQGARKRLNQV